MTAAAESDAPSPPLISGFARSSLGRPTNPFIPFDKRELDQSIPDRFEQQVRRYPDKVAVCTTGASLTYGQLNQLANQIARLILTQGNADNQPVALLFGQRALLIAAILGSLKAGKLYVPLDPLHQPSRNADILADASATLILTDSSHLGHANKIATPTLPVFDLDALSDDLPTEDLRLAISPDRLAYLFYTSGSTGKPKGLADTHRNVLHNIMRYTNSLHICVTDRLTLLQAASFSGSVSSLFCALLNGATSFPFSLHDEGPERLANWVSREAITVYHSVPSIFRLLATGRHRYPALRVIRLEGDQASPKDIELYKEHFPDTCILVNGLGATECGIVRQYFVTKATPVPETVVPIGYAVEDMDVTVVDESGQPVDCDCVGEIAVRSRYLAPGYWKRPDLTATAFLADSRGGDVRVYRTGDIGRMRADGCLEHLGRRNFQRRIRGQWVEIAEVERALRSQSLFKDVVVLTLEGNTSEPRVVAYLVPGDGPRPKIDDVRRQLLQRLPTHMVPSAFVWIDAVPLTANGKVDRRALPPPSQQRPDLNVPYVAPHDLLELQLKQTWEAVLGVAPIGSRDNFFDLGGDSLNAVAMIAEVEHATGRAIPPDLLLAGGTIEHLAGYLSDRIGELMAPMVEINKGTSGRPFYFLHGDYMSGGYYVLNLARHLGPDRPVFALPPCGANGSPVLESYEEMARFHLQAIRAHQPSGPYLLGGTCNGGLVAYEIARRLSVEGERVDALVLIAASVANLRLKHLRQLVAPLRVFSKQAERRVFARLNPFWSALMLLPPPQRLGFVLSKLPRWLKLLRDSVPGTRAIGAKYSVGRRGQPDTVPGVASRTRLAEIYHQIDREYWPGRYPDKVILFCWNGEAEGPAEMARWWKQIAAEVELHTFRGTWHGDSLTGQAEVVGKHLLACLESAG